MVMISKRWKAIEGKVAKYFDAMRIPLSGINSRHGTSSDTDHPHFYIEIKHGKTWGFLREFPISQPSNNWWVMYDDVLCVPLFQWLTIYKDHEEGIVVPQRPSMRLKKLFNDTEGKARQEGKIMAITVIHPHGFDIGDSFCFLKRLDNKIDNN